MRFLFVIALCLPTFTLAIAELLTDLALKKPTEQSSTNTYALGGFPKTGDSEHVVDGNTRTDSENITCSETSAGYVTWWVVDLLNIYLIQEVAILVRMGGNALNNFVVEVSPFWNDTSDELIEPVLCYQQSADFPRLRLVLLPCLTNITGRYVRVTKNRPQLRRLSMCQFEVHGYTIDDPTSAGVNDQVSLDEKTFEENQRMFWVEYFPERRSTSGFIETLSVGLRSYLLCFLRCLEVTNCTSFNMATKDDVCEVLSNENEGQNVSGWIQYQFSGLAGHL